MKCNWCKKDISDYSGMNFIEGAEFEITFGYGSRYDRNSYEFCVCDDCFKRVFLKKVRK